MSSAHAGSVSYVYDGAGRLVTATSTDGSSVQYGYDAAGNRTQQTVVCTSCGPPPIAGNVSADIGYNTTGTVVSFALSGGAPTSAAITTPTSGTAVLNGTSGVTYTPATNYSGTATFQYTASNTGGTSNSATATLSVKQPPVAVTETFNITHVIVAGTTTYCKPAVKKTVTTNDTDPYGYVLSIDSFTQGTYGTVTLGTNPATQLNYKYGACSTGAPQTVVDHFNYTVRNPLGGKSTVTETITYTVTTQ